MNDHDCKSATTEGFEKQIQNPRQIKGVIWEVSVTKDIFFLPSVDLDRQINIVTHQLCYCPEPRYTHRVKKKKTFSHVDCTIG